MTSWVLLAAALSTAPPDPCAPVAPAPQADPVAAAAYRRVGDEERSAGSADTATAAYRSALSLDPGDERSRAALAELCAAARGQGTADDFERGLALMKEGETRRAAEAFERVPAKGPDASAALLAGVCRYQLGEYEPAAAHLRSAEADPLHAALARYYLGLVALAEGAPREAAGLLDSAASGPEVAAIARDLARYAWRQQRLVLSASSDVVWDSNATLAPGGTPLASASDGAFDLAAGGLFRPAGESGPYLRASALLHEQLRVHSLDMLGASGGAGWQFGRLGNALVLSYDYDWRSLDGAPYLSANRLGVSGWTSAGPVVLTAGYSARWEEYQSPTFDPFDGIVQRAEAKASLAVSRTAWLTLGYGLSSDSVRVDSLSWLEQGPAAVLRWLPGSRWRLVFGASAIFRDYQAVAPALGVRRQDAYLDGAVLAEYELGLEWTIWLSLDMRKAFSNVAQYAYTRVAPMAGVSFVTGM